MAYLGNAALWGPWAARAQPAPGRLRRIGFLSPQSASSAGSALDALRQGLHDLGWQEGQSIVFETRYADGAIDRLPALARELVGQNVDIMVAGSNLGVLAAIQETRRIPIIMVTSRDPVAGGLVASLARPGANVTGVTTVATELSGKRLELLREAVPGITRVAFLTNPDNPYTPEDSKEVAAAAQAMGMDLRTLEVRGPDQLEAAFAAMRDGGAQALVVVSEIMLITYRARVAELAACSRLPAIYFDREFVTAGGLMFYGASLVDMYRQAAKHADKVLKGAQPAELPVEQPTRFELAINLKAARALGVALPPALLARADEVIE